MVNPPPFPEVLPLDVTLRTAAPQRLPPFLGSAAHGTLARALYHTVCAFPRRTACMGCPLYTRCAYPALFATPAPAHEQLRALGIRDEAPRPLVLAPEAGWTRPSGNPFRLDAGVEIPMRVTLIGRAAADLPIVVVALKKMADRGLGVAAETDLSQKARPRRVALSLTRIATGGANQTIYDGDSDVYTPAAAGDPALTGGPAPTSIRMHLVSPLRLKRNGRFLSNVTPLDFLLTLARRASALNVLYGNGEPVVDEAEVATKAADVAVIETNLRRVHVTRYSTRQQRRMQWPGLTGHLHWGGPGLAAVWPLLRFGELVQLGKGAALGFGRYRLEILQPQ
jgi:hypothetical protein